MLFHVEMVVTLPPDMLPERASELKAQELAQAQELQRDGRWRHLWRIVGRYANISIFDVKGHDELHSILTSLPLFPYMSCTVTALCRHPSSIHETDR